MNALTQPKVNGWHAQMHLRFAVRDSRTKMVERHRTGPLSVQRGFYPEGALCHSYLLHPPGGVVGGDRIDVTCQVDTNAQALVTTPGATKFYRSSGATAYQHQVLRVDAEASLEWLPQETIYFSGAQARLVTHVELHPNGRFIGWEMHCAGRPVMQEAFNEGQVWTALNLTSEGQPLLRDLSQFGAQHNSASHRDYAMQSTLVAGWADGSDLGTARQVLAQHAGLLAGATLVDGLLVIRALCQSTDQVLPCWIDIWSALRPDIIGRPACPPRIWNT